ncbi:MAG: two-component sensor histidine kinase, partial [Aquincola sp.]|nr:two-component sensor histidine kinase [Aquincola sp.]
EDDGPGVPEDERPLLWQRFRRGREAGGTGSGLGLAIVADIARLHGAQAELQAGAGGRGLKVLVRFPAPGA